MNKLILSLLCAASCLTSAITAHAQEPPFYSKTLSNTPVQVTTGPTRVYGYKIINDNDQPVFIHVYDALAGSVTVGTTAQTKMPWPGRANGYDYLVRNGSVHEQFTVGLTIAATMGPTGDKDNSTTAPTIPISIVVFYQK